MEQRFGKSTAGGAKSWEEALGLPELRDSEASGSSPPGHEGEPLSAGITESMAWIGCP